MPCYDSYISPYNSVSFDLVSEIVTRIFGLTNNSEPTEHEYHLSERKQLSNYERIEKYKKHLRRAFILCMKGNYISGLFIPHQLEVDYYNDQLLKNYLVDENYSVCEKEINICKDEKSGYEYIDSVELINNVASVCPQFHELIIFNNGAGNNIWRKDTQLFEKET